MNIRANPVQRVSILLPNARWREGTGKLNQSIGASSGFCCMSLLCKAGPAEPDGFLSAVEEYSWWSGFLPALQ